MLERESQPVVDGENLDLRVGSIVALGSDEPVLGGPVGVADDVVQDDDALELILEDIACLPAHRILLKHLVELRKLDGVVHKDLEGANLQRRKIVLG